MFSEYQVITSVLLILFVLGSSLMLAFKISGNTNNATRVLDIVTDDVFGTVEESYNKIRGIPSISFISMCNYKLVTKYDFVYREKRCS